MADPFLSTHRTLAEPSRAPGWALVAAVLLFGWGGWVAVASVGVRLGSPDARVEVAEQAIPLRVEGAGRVLWVSLRPGARVAAGEELVVLDAATEVARLAAESATLAGLEAEAVQLASRLAEGAKRSGALHHSTLEAERGAGGALDAARAAERIAADEAGRLAQLLDVHAAAQWEWQRADAAATEAHARRIAAEAEVARLGGEVVRAGAEGEGSLATLRQDEANLRARIGVARALVAVAQAALERRTLRSPQAGIIGEAPPLVPGAVVAVGDHVATLVPEGEPVVVASFPGTALGRIQPGQRAALRADAFDWVRYGVVALTVSEVAAETRDDQLRVVLTPAEASTFPLAHGLSGSVEIEVERVTPLTLVLRAAGALVRPVPVVTASAVSR